MRCFSFYSDYPRSNERSLFSVKSHLWECRTRSEPTAGGSTERVSISNFISYSDFDTSLMNWICKVNAEQVRFRKDACARCQTLRPNHRLLKRFKVHSSLLPSPPHSGLMLLTGANQYSHADGCIHRVQRKPILGLALQSSCNYDVLARTSISLAPQNTSLTVLL